MEKINMKRWLFPLCLATSLGTGAQDLKIEGTYKGGDAAALALVARPMDAASAKATVKLAASGETFTGAVPVAHDGLYALYGNNEGRQLMAPFYCPDAAKACNLKLQVQENGCPVIGGSKDNEALSAFNTLVYERGRDFWTRGKDMGVETVKLFLKGYGVSADSLATHYKCAEPVRKYLELWAYITAYGNYEGWASEARRSGKEVALELADVLEEPYKMLDIPMAAYFPSTTYLILQALPEKSSLEDRLAYMEEHYKCVEIRKAVGSILADGFVRGFDFSGDFEAGLTRLQKATDKFGLDQSYVENFKKRKSSAKGKPFPTGITLVDAEGNKVDFASFKGRYVYIDLWASWCGPCVKEVPHLQKLEKELENKDVVFVSISLDKSEKAWKDKMKALNMHGHQLLNQDNSLAEALNVQGIPYFVIYDKEGQLYMSNAPRPSHPALKELLEGLH